MKDVLIFTAWIAAIISPLVSAQTQTVSITNSDKKTIAKTVVETKVDCPAHKYSLQLDRQGKQMLFAVDGQTHPYDLSTSKLGQDFLNVPTYGSYSFICGPSNIVLHFFGVEIKSEGAPVPVSYIAIIHNDGEVDVPNGYEVRDYKALSPLAKSGLRR
jgi:hypothetical protein